MNFLIQEDDGTARKATAKEEFVRCAKGFKIPKEKYAGGHCTVNRFDKINTELESTCHFFLGKRSSCYYEHRNLRGNLQERMNCSEGKMSYP